MSLLYFPSQASGSSASSGMTFINKSEASADTSVSLALSGSSYNVQLFVFDKFHMNTASADFMFQTSTDGSSYAVNRTSSADFTFTRTSDNNFAYSATESTGGATTFQSLIRNGNWASTTAAYVFTGFLWLYNAADTGQYKNYYAQTVLNNTGGGENFVMRLGVSGTFTTTTALTHIQFKPESGNFTGTITNYGFNLS
jgi:hypothetical protein